MQAECVCRVQRALAERVHASALTCALYLYQYTPDLAVALPCRVYIWRNKPLQSAYRPARSPIWLWPLSLVSCPSLVYACRSVCVSVCVCERVCECECVCVCVCLCDLVDLLGVRMQRCVCACVHV
jgi:hypothetical protein